MEQPLCYIARGKSVVCKLKKTIYGLKQSLQGWIEKFSKVIGAVGFQRYYSDHSVFIRRRPSGIVVLTIYADDVLLQE